MKLTIAIDPGKSGGYAIAWNGLHTINLHTLDEDFEFVEHIQDLKDHPDVKEIEACLLYTSPSPRDYAAPRMPSSA